MSGYIYFLSNIAFPGLIKIGHTTTSVQERLSQLNSTGVPAPFNVVASFMVDNPVHLEKQIHKKLDKYRYNKNREFFEVSTKTALTELVAEILQALSDTTNSLSAKDDRRQQLFDEKSILLLKELAYRRRNVGYAVYELKDVTGESEIETINRLAKLKESGLIEEKKHRENYRLNIWRINSKGIKYLFDNNLVDDFMKNDIYL
jgi:chaperonin GroEL (HSP60 family)